MDNSRNSLESPVDAQTKSVSTWSTLALVIPGTLLIVLLGVAFAIPLLSRFGQVVIPPFYGGGIQVAAGCGAAVMTLVVLTVVGQRSAQRGPNQFARISGMLLSILAGAALIPAIPSTLWLTSWWQSTRWSPSALRPVAPKSWPTS